MIVHFLLVVLTLVHMFIKCETKTQVNILVLLPQNDTYKFSASKLLPPLYMAASELEAKQQEFQIKIVHDTCDCGGLTAAINAMQNIYGERNHSLQFQAIFGPMCDYATAPVSRYAFYWNVIVLTANALAPQFRNYKHQEYKTLTVIGPSLHWLDNFIKQLFAKFNWKQVILIFDKTSNEAETNSQCFLIMASLKNALLSNNITVDYKLRDNDRRSNEDILVDYIGVKFSVIFLCGNPNFVNDIMLAAKRLNFTNGEYVFINFDLYAHLYNDDRVLRPWLHVTNKNESLVNETIEAYESLLIVTVKFEKSLEKYGLFKKNLIDFMNTRNETCSELNYFSASFYDMMYLYIDALNRTLSQGFSPNNIQKVLGNLWNHEFSGITGAIAIDSLGERKTEYILYDMSPTRGKFEEAIGSTLINHTTMVLNYDEQKRPIYWSRFKNDPLADSPKCGYDNSKCPKAIEKLTPPWIWITVSMAILMLFMLVISLFSYRKLKFEAELKAMNWLIKWEDVKVELSPNSFGQVRAGDDFYENDERTPLHIASKESIEFTNKAVLYKRNLCFVKKLYKQKIEINRSLLLEVKKIKNLQHDHICRFIGLCISNLNQFVFTEYCQKGSLQDILENQEIQLEIQFKYHLIHDIIKGMLFLHSSELKSHGNLTSANCVVDSRFTVKITDFGLSMLKTKNFDSNETFYRKLLWIAPELYDCKLLQGTQKGDIYSFGIIMHEILYRSGVFYLTDDDKHKYFKKINVSSKELCDKIRYEELRPSIDNRQLSDIEELMQKCWCESPNERPDFAAIRDSMRKITKISGNILDNLLARMEQYANNLEDLVKERTVECENERKRAETLLYRLLPSSVASQLMQGQHVRAEHFDSVTIYFSDICGFTRLSSESTPMQVVDLLNGLYTLFDSIIGNFDVYKVETIGDAYMVVSGLPQRNDTHAREIARMALALLNTVKSFKIPHLPNEQLKLRIGLHTGPCVAGVVGLKMPRYCLFGDTVNTASRMESNGEPLKIHVSPQTKEALDKYSSFNLQLRGTLDVKGKGQMTTYWLQGENISLD